MATQTSPPIMIASQAGGAPPTTTTPHPPRNRDSFNLQALGRGTSAHVRQARVLMVGAGGIGCELLKNLALTGFGEIHVVDLDTIDLSNLNRQFLFRHEHIKKSKALVAKDAAQRFNPNVKIVAHHANIKDGRFGVSWFKGFNLVFNALDNLDARRHVNKMCLAADVPLVESGTTGFNGQVQVIKKGVTACYDCTPKETPKSFPVCTIRSTPSQPIHCIVWAKSYLLNEIFGASEDESAFDHSADEQNAREIAELRRESDELRRIRESVGTPEFPRMLFDKVFHKDIARLRSIEDMWKSRRPPEPLDYDALLASSSSSSDAAAPSVASLLADGQRVWTLEENLAVFNDSLARLSRRMAELRRQHDQQEGATGPEPIITFDKDDEDTLDFVAASANIRSSIFGIDRKSKFDIKQMAGNIIPAIATTNAIVAGLCVLESFKVLRGEYDEAKEVFLTPFALGRLLASDRPRRPNPECPVCSVYTTSVYVDLARATLQDLVEDFLRTELGYGEKEISVSNDVGILYDPDETENLSRKLSDLGIRQDSTLTVVDEDEEDPYVNVVIHFQESEGSSRDKPVQGLLADRKPEIPRKPKKTPAREPKLDVGGTNGKHAAAADNVVDDDDEVELVQEGGAAKRPRPDEEQGEGQPAKKARIAGADDDGVVVVDDEAGGAIVIDD
ncbi:hypothetical protein VTK73DRAFT_8271 [Phialemonium thermophilum]|uniref:Ubiquitin-activating enzyme E1-like n=1 Tax=Phialemonium thermophilum TaxID=223376 RepID=A0ABR3W9I1_9PEZI